MGRPRAYDEATRDALLAAAGRLLAEGGPAAVTVRAVAADVGATTRAVYGLFGSKEELIRALYVTGFEGLDRTLGAVPRTDDPLADLSALGWAYRDSALARPHLYQVMFAAPSGAFAPTEDDLALSLGTLERLRETVTRCVDAGVLEGDAAVLTLRAWALSHGLAALELRGALGDEAQAVEVWRSAIGDPD